MRRTWKVTVNGYEPMIRESADFPLASPEDRQFMMLVALIEDEHYLVHNAEDDAKVHIPVRDIIPDALKDTDSHVIADPCWRRCVSVGRRVKRQLGGPGQRYYRIEHVPRYEHDVAIDIIDEILHKRMLHCRAACAAILAPRQWAPFDRHVRALIAWMTWGTRWAEVWDTDNGNSQKKLKAE